MNDAEHAVARYRSLSIIRLFRLGPWELILTLWVIGATLLYVWLTTPILRLATVIDPRFAAAAVACQMGLLASRVSLLLYGNPKAVGRRLAIAAALLVGAVGGWFAAEGPWSTVSAQASACAPVVASAMTQNAGVASYVIPVGVWLAWCLFLLNGFPGGEGFHFVVAGSATSRYRAYAQALRMVPVRVLASGAVASALFLAVNTQYSVEESAPWDKSLMTVKRLPATDIGGDAIVQRIAYTRSDAEAQALTQLGSLKFDDAVAPVVTAACTLRFPGDRVDDRVVSAQESFDVLNRAFAANDPSWSGSPVATRAIVNLLPIAPPTPSEPVCPMMWPSDKPTSMPAPRTQRDIRISAVKGQYQGRDLVEVKLASAEAPSGESITLEVAMKVAGVASVNSDIFKVMERRLKTAPSEGPKTIGQGAACATWSLNSVGVRVGPGVGTNIPDSALTPRSPLWITCYDQSYSRLVEDLYEGWSPHHCHRIR